MKLINTFIKYRQIRMELGTEPTTFKDKCLVIVSGLLTPFRMIINSGHYTLKEMFDMEFTTHYINLTLWYEFTGDEQCT